MRTKIRCSLNPSRQKVDEKVKMTGKLHLEVMKVANKMKYFWEKNRILRKFSGVSRYNI